MIENTEWANHKDEATWIILDLISTYLWFHEVSCETWNNIWTTLESLFGKRDEMRGHIFEVEFNTSDPKFFDNIHDLYTRFKSLILSLAHCGIYKSTQVDHLILTMLDKPWPKYVFYVSTFHSGRYLLGWKWKMPTMEKFIHCLTHEHGKCI
jgi:hypothetical protein